MKPSPPVIDDETLLLRFNQREPEAFGTVYSRLYERTVTYADRLYTATEIEGEDAVSKIFCDLWQNRSKCFESLEQILAYILIALHNDYKDRLKHLRHKEIYQNYVKRDRELFETTLIESEVFSYLHNILSLLPADCALIMRRFFGGFSTEEIAQELGKSKQTVYNRKHEALKLLKAKISEFDYMLIILLLGQSAKIIS